MKVIYDESFEKSVKKLKDSKVKSRVIELIDIFENADALQVISNIKKMQGFQNYYRIRIGDYRLGFELLDENSVLFILIAHRKEIYRYFP